MIASLAYRVSGRKRQRIKTSVAAVFGSSLTAVEQRRVVQGSYDAFWDDAFALATRQRDLRRLRDLPVEGLHHLEAALADGRGAILWESSAFGRRNLAKQALYARGFSMSQVHADSHLAGFGDYRRQTWFRHRVVKPTFDRWTRAFVAEVIDLTRDGGLAFTRVLTSRLADNRILCIAADGSMGHGWVTVPFLGGPTQLATGTVRLARLAGAPLLPLIGVLEDGPRVVIHEPIHVDVGGDRERLALEVVTRFAEVVEGWVRRHPEQYRGWPTLHQPRYHDGPSQDCPAAEPGALIPPKA